MKKWKNLSIVLFVGCCLLTGCDRTAEIPENYDQSIQNAEVYTEIPALRQYGDYTCGTTCVQMIMNYLYPYDGDINLKSYEEDLGTDPVEGTSGERIAAFFDENGVTYTQQEEISLEELTAYLQNGNIVMMCIQAWSAADDGGYNLSDSSGEDYLTEGHWVICVGYGEADGETQYYFNDPACVGHCVMNASDLESRWIDMDGTGKIYHHFGFIIACGDAYDSDGVYYLY